MTGGAKNIIHFAQGGVDNGKYGDRVPKVYLIGQSFTIDSAVSGQWVFRKTSDSLEGGQTYDLEIEQSKKEDGKIYYEIKVIGDVLHSVENTDAQDFENVHVYAGSPYSTPFSSEHGRLENLEWEILSGC